MNQALLANIVPRLDRKNNTKTADIISQWVQFRGFVPPVAMIIIKMFTVMNYNIDFSSHEVKKEAL